MNTEYWLNITEEVCRTEVLGGKPFPVKNEISKLKKKNLKSS
jgi:hypothetical protein